MSFVDDKGQVSLKPNTNLLGKYPRKYRVVSVVMGVTNQGFFDWICWLLYKSKFIADVVKYPCLKRS